MPIQLLLFLFPVLGAVLAAIPGVPSKALRQVSAIVGVATFLIVGWLSYTGGFFQEGEVASFFAGKVLRLDALACFLLLLVSVLYASVMLVSVRYMGEEQVEGIVDARKNRLYYGMGHLFVLSMLLAAVANHVGVLWFALEATTLSTTLLVAFYRKEGGVEAAWKYVLLCSTGIALGLIGVLMVGFAATQAGLSPQEAFNLAALRASAGSLSPDLMRWAFVFLFIGIGTKVGFVPMHTWLPDAHSKTPSPISAFLSGTLLNCAFVTILRFKDLVDFSLNQTWWTERFFLVFGLLSVALPAFIFLGLRNYKRLLAYSSVEHMGLMAICVGLGPIGVVPMLMHMAGHTLAKSGLFFGAGEWLLRYKTTKIDLLPRLMRTDTRTAGLFLALMLALLAVPLSPLFASEYFLVAIGINLNKPITFIFMLLLVLAFVGMMRATFAMLFDPTMLGTESHEPSREAAHPEGWRITHGVMAVHVVLLVALGYWFFTAEGFQVLSRVAKLITSTV
ncbi:hypothetical protein HYV73_02075 [Candidatus Uhrbacteria bacterium]|nr:hypothetical protein [Candidatus Uhrbacteria bacterium]